METGHFIDTNEETDTNYTNYHEGSERLGQFVQIREIRVSVSLSS